MATWVLALRSYAKVVSLLCVFVIVINGMNFLFLKQTIVDVYAQLCVHASVVCMLWIMIAFDFCVNGCEFEYFKT